MSVNEKMTAIADNIRSKTGGTEALTPDDMASGVNEVYEAGKKAERCVFFDNFINTPSELEFNYRFAGSGWNDKTFYPTSDIISGEKRANHMFTHSKISDLDGRLKEQGVILDLSEATRIDNLFSMCKELTVVPTLNLSNCPYEKNEFKNLFNSCSKLHTIRKLILPTQRVHSDNRFHNAFIYCTSLVNIEIEGVISSTISFVYSPLSVESIKSVITHLQDYSEIDALYQYYYTVTFKSTAFEALEAEGNTSPNGNTWAEYIDDLKWNLTLA